MQPSPTPLQPRQLLALLFLALVAAAVGFGLSSRVFTPNDKTGTAQQVNVDRRDAEQGRVYIREESDRELTYQQPTQMQVYVPHRSSMVMPDQARRRALRAQDTKSAPKWPALATTKAAIQATNPNTPQASRSDTDARHAQQLSPARSFTANGHLASNTSTSSTVRRDRRPQRPIHQKSYSPARPGAAAQKPARDHTESRSVAYDSPRTGLVTETGSSQRRYPYLSMRKAPSDLLHCWTSNVQLCRFLLDQDSLVCGVSFNLTTQLLICHNRSYSSARYLGLGRHDFAPRYSTVCEPLGVITCNYGSESGATLSPEPPKVGQKLATSSGSINQAEYSLSLVNQVFDNGLFCVSSAASDSALGSPMVNDRGEIAGVLLEGIPRYPGRCYRMAADSSWLRQLAERGPVDYGPNSINDLAQMLLDQDLQAAQAQYEAVSPDFLRRNSRILPGQAMGNFYLGCPMQKITKVLGPGQYYSEGDGYYMLRYPNYKLSFTIYANRVADIHSSDNSYATAQGVGPGTHWRNARLDAALQGTNACLQPNGHRLLVGKGLEVDINGNGIVAGVRVTLR